MSKGLKNFLAILITLIIIAGLCVGAFYIGKNGIKKPETPTEETKQESGLVSPEEVVANGIKIAAAPISPSLYDTYAVPRAAEAALTLTVTPTPADAELTGAKFTIAFKNASSAWATGKTVTEYVTLSQSNEKQATVSCLKAFGEPIVVTYTVKGENGANKTATYQLDYRARIVSTENIYIDNEQQKISSGVDLLNLTTSLGVELKYSDYTVKENFSVTTNKISVGANLIANLKSKSITLPATEFISTSPTVKEQTGGLNVVLDLDGLISKIFGNEGTIYKTAAFREALSNSEDHIEISITLSDTYSTYDIHDRFNLNVNTLPKAAQSVQFSGGSQHTF